MTHRGRKSAAETIVKLAVTGNQPKPTPPAILTTDEQTLFNQWELASCHARLMSLLNYIDLQWAGMFGGKDDLM
jgi:hypothetical protein